MTVETRVEGTRCMQNMAKTDTQMLQNVSQRLKASKYARNMFLRLIEREKMIPCIECKNWTISAKLVKDKHGGSDSA